jgi:hypothetical protein
MIFTQPVQQFWAFVATYCLAAVVLMVMIGAMFGWLAVLLAGVILVGALLIVGMIGQPLFVPHRVRDWQVQPLTWAELCDRGSHCDLSWLARYDQTLRDLGFQPLQDYTAARSTNPLRSVVRCFYHPIEGCLAEVGFIFSANGEVRVSHTVFFSIFEQGWMLIDFNHAPNRRESLIYAWHDRREVRRYYPQLTVEEVFRGHLQMRDQMAETLNLSALPQTTWEMYQEIQRELIVRPWRRLRRRNLFVAMLEAAQFERHPKYEWLGDYRKVQNRPIGDAVGAQALRPESAPMIE